MPTVIDSLIVQLGLDTKNFTQGQRQAAAQLRSFQQQAERSARNIEDSTRRVTQFLSGLRSQAVGLFSIMLGATGLEELTRRIVTQSSAIDKLSNRYNVSAEYLSKFGNLVKSVGGSVEEAQGFVQQLAHSLLLVDQNLPDDLAQKLNNLAGVAREVGIPGFLARGAGGKMDVEATLRNIAEVMARQTVQRREFLATQLGIPSGVFEVFRQGGFAGRLGRTPGIDKELADASQKLVEAFNQLQNRLTVVAAKLLDPIIPAITEFANVLEKMATLTGRQFIKNLLGIDVGGGEAPPVWFDLPGAVKGLFGGKAKAAPSPGGGATFNERFGFPTTGPQSSLGNAPIGMAALANSMQLNTIPGFRVTSTTGGQHAGAAHGEGRAMDFVVNSQFYDQVVSELRRNFEKEGLTVIDASKKPDSRFWTGPHVHIEFATRAAMERFQAAHGMTDNSTKSETHIGNINVHAPTGNAQDITSTINKQIRRSSQGDNADTGFE